jgi:anti-sigma factor RsiW
MTTECYDLELLSRAIDGDLDAEEHRRVDEHIETCAACRRATDALLALGERVRGAAAPVDAIAGRRALRDILTGRAGRPRRWAVTVPVPAAAAALGVVALVVGLAVGMWRPPARPPVVPAVPATQDLSRYDRGNRLEIYVARHGREAR